MKNFWNQENKATNPVTVEYTPIKIDNELIGGIIELNSEILNSQKYGFISQMQMETDKSTSFEIWAANNDLDKFHCDRIGYFHEFDSDYYLGISKIGALYQCTIGHPKKGLVYLGGNAEFMKARSMALDILDKVAPFDGLTGDNDVHRLKVGGDDGKLETLEKIFPGTTNNLLFNLNYTPVNAVEVAQRDEPEEEPEADAWMPTKSLEEITSLLESSGEWQVVSEGIPKKGVNCLFYACPCPEARYNKVFRKVSRFLDNNRDNSAIVILPSEVLFDKKGQVFLKDLVYSYNKDNSFKSLGFWDEKLQSVKLDTGETTDHNVIILGLDFSRLMNVFDTILLGTLEY
ncbi:MAG: hypothetical protein F6K55_03315 [Moorea sp. SIO4A3]|nr:hypothetical protein [Moorena sp. SIO4A3]